MGCSGSSDDSHKKSKCDDGQNRRKIRERPRALVLMDLKRSTEATITATTTVGTAMLARTANIRRIRRARRIKRIRRTRAGKPY